MCQFDICACQPVQSGRSGPRVAVVIDRRTRPWTGGPRERRVVEIPVLEDRRVAERNCRERSEARAGVPTWWLESEERRSPSAP